MVCEVVERGRGCGTHLLRCLLFCLLPVRSSFQCCLPAPVPACQGVLDFKGGETAALERLHYYLWGSDLVATYFDTRNGMLGGWVRWKSGAYREGDWQRETARCRPGWQCRQCAVVCAPLRSAPLRPASRRPALTHCPTAPNRPPPLSGGDYSTKFAPWLAHGCLSPREVYRELKRYERQRTANKSTYWVQFELSVRDFWRFFALKQGSKVFLEGGVNGRVRHKEGIGQLCVCVVSRVTC